VTKAHSHCSSAAAGFVRRHDRTAAHRGTQRVVGRLCLPCGAGDGVDHSARRDRQAEPLAPQARDLRVGQTEILVEDDGERDRLRPELHGGRAQRIGRLQRMPALHAALTRPTVSDRDAEAPHDRPLHRQLFLILRRDPVCAHRAPASGALRRQRCVVRLIDVARYTPVAVPPVRRTRPATGDPGLGDSGPPRERRGLPIHRASRRLEILFQFLVFTPQPLPLGLRPPQILAQALDLPTLLVDDYLRVRRRGAGVALRHAPVMPDSRAPYKRKMRTSIS